MGFILKRYKNVALNKHQKHRFCCILICITQQVIPWKIVNTIKIQSLPYHLTQRKKKLNQKEALSRRTELSLQKAQWLSGQDVDILEAEVTACEMRTDLIEHSRWDSTRWVSMCTSENSRHISTHASPLQCPHGQRATMCCSHQTNPVIQK